MSISIEGGGGGGKPYESSALKVTEGSPLERSKITRKRWTGTRKDYNNMPHTKYDLNRHTCIDADSRDQIQ